MLGQPEALVDKPISQHFLENLILDLALAPAQRVIILLQTKPEGTTIELDENKKPIKKGIKYYIKKIYEEEGIGGFWKGCLFDIAKNGMYRIASSLFLHLYEPLVNLDDSIETDIKKIVGDFALFCVVETTLQFFQHPSKVIRVRLAAFENVNDPLAPEGFKRFTQCIQRIHREDGLRGFYRGFEISLIESLINAIQITTQKLAAQRFVSDAQEDNSLISNIREVASERTLGSVLSAFFSTTEVGRRLRRRLKTIAFQGLRRLANLALVYPFRVVQRRIIMHKSEWKVQRTSTRGMIRDIWRTEGIRGFYAGLNAQIWTDFGFTVLSPFVASFAGRVIPEQVKALASVGDINETAGNTSKSGD